MNSLQKSMHIYYKHYMDKNNLLNFENFIKFTKDFEIFPDLLSKPKLLQIFSVTSKLYKLNTESCNIPISPNRSKNI